MYLHDHLKPVKISLCQIDPFYPLKEPPEVLLIRFKVDLGVMTMKDWIQSTQSYRTF